MTRLTDQDLDHLEKRNAGYGQFTRVIRTLIAEVRRLRHALEDICRRHEERDTGQGFAQNPGPLAWAMWQTAKKALEQEEEGDNEHS